MNILSNDAQSVNFREICMGNIAPGMLFRSSHPIKDNRQDRTIALLSAGAKISAVINLSDTMSGIYGNAIFAPWYNKLLCSGKVIALGMDFSFTSPGFRKKLKEALQFIIHTEGPYLIHCHAGVDRTGFVCMVIESFMGASLNKVLKDYLLSFNSGFESSIQTASQRADENAAIEILSLISNSQMISRDNLQHIVEIYLRSTIRLSVEEVELLREKLNRQRIIFN